MGYLDSTSSIVTCILTRKGRELIARNDGSFRISKFAFGDDEVNYSLYNATLGTDTDILNLPILEPSSNESAALRYRLVTAPKGTISVAFITVTPTDLTLQTTIFSSPGGTGVSQVLPNTGIILVQTQGGFDHSGYLVTSRNSNIASIPTSNVASSVAEDGSTIASIRINGGIVGGNTIVDIVGKDTGAVVSVPVTTTIAGY